MLTIPKPPKLFTLEQVKTLFVRILGAESPELAGLDGVLEAAEPAPLTTIMEEQKRLGDQIIAEVQRSNELYKKYNDASAEKTSYVPQGIAIEAMEALQEAGMGEVIGKPNTFLAMVKEICETLKKRQIELTNLRNAATQVIRYTMKWQMDESKAHRDLQHEIGTFGPDLTFWVDVRKVRVLLGQVLTQKDLDALHAADKENVLKGRAE